MGENDQATTFNDPASNAPDAAAADKGKGKAVEEPTATQELSMDEDSDEESENEEMVSLPPIRRVLLQCRVNFDNFVGPRR